MNSLRFVNWTLIDLPYDRLVLVFWTFELCLVIEFSFVYQHIIGVYSDTPPDVRHQIFFRRQSLDHPVFNKN